MDNFKEDIVTSRSTLLHNVLYALCWVMIVISGVYAFLLLQVLMMVAFSVGTLVTLLLSAACWAQADAPAAPTAREAAPADRHSQRVEHIQLEDAGSRVDEVRSGGETRRITVQPKAEVPPYEVQPAGALNREAGPGAAGRRVWKIPF